MRLDPQPFVPPGGEALRMRVAELFRRVNSTVNALIEGRASAIYTARDAAPTSGVWARGDYVVNAAPAQLGPAGSRYIVYGWKRLTTGAGNVLNTDWFEDRRPTGN